MSVFGTKLNRIVAAGALAVCVLSAGMKVFAADAPATQAAAPGPTSLPSPDSPIAEIQGRQINRQRFNDILMKVAGMRVFQQVLDLVLVEQACQGVGIPLEGDEYQARVKAEYDKVLAGLGGQFTDAQRPQVLAQVLRQKGMTDVEFQMAMQRSAGLRALAKASGKITVSPDELSTAYQAQYGEKADIVLIPVRSMEESAAIRDAVENKGRDAMMAAQENGSQPQAITISKNADQFKPIRDTVWQMKEKTLSATIQQGGNQYLVYLIKMNPAQPNIKFDSVKGDLQQKVLDLKESQWMNQHMAELRQNAAQTIKIYDPELQREFMMIEEQIRQAQAANATQAATQPGAAAQPNK